MVATNGVAQVPASLVVHRSAYVERLLDPLVERLRGTVDDPFAPLRIVVQSHGMRRWLSHQLAERLDDGGGGILANVEFPFPGRFVRDVVAACGQAPQADDVALDVRGRYVPDDDPWQPERLAWHVARLLIGSDGHPQLATITRGLDVDLAAGVVGRRTWRLARAVADVFNDYVVYRAEMAEAWSRGRDVGADGRALEERDTWQPWLWRALLEHLDDPVRRIGDAVDALRERSGGLDRSRLPTDVAVFGLSTLPARHLDLLAALATHTGVELYVPTPSPERWARVSGAASEGSAVGDARHPLLASCGRVTDDAAQLFARHGPVDDDLDGSRRGGDATGGGAHPDTLLAYLQSDLRTDRFDAIDAPRRSLDPDDASVQIHRCHGPARQAEVLRDVVLGLLADDDTLEPRDVIVLTPDVDRFAPLVQSAFDGDGRRPQLPVSVADRQLGRTDPVADALLAVVRLARGRVSATEVLDVLGREPVARRAGIRHHDLAVVARWVADAGIRWGIDPEDRAGHGQPADRHHTWRAGMDRLLLGVTMADEDDRIVGDVTPYDHMEGDDVELLGRFADACETLFRAIRELRRTRTPGQWHGTLTRVATSLIAVDEDERWRLHELTDQLGALAEAPDVEVDLGSVEVLLGELLERRRGAAGYETGAVTLCELVPMRSIPHRVVCLLGLDDDAYPRSSIQRGYDLLERHRRAGDPDRSDEDRHLLLEAVLSARDHLVVAVTGRDPRTNERRPPAVVVSELAEAIDRAAQAPDRGSAAEAVTVEHPLHAFSPSAFGSNGPARSFDVGQLDVARAMQRRAYGPWPFLEGAPPPDDEGTAAAERVTLDRLAETLTSPTRTFLEQRLGLYLREWRTRLDDTEPFDIDPLRRAGHARQVLSRLGDEEAIRAWASAVRSGGTLPAGTPGLVVVEQLVAETVALVDALRGDLSRLGADDAPEPHVVVSHRELEVDLDGREITGAVELVEADPVPVQIVVDPRGDRPGRRMAAWVNHVALHLAVGPVATILVYRGSGRPARHRFAPLSTDAEVARERAESLLARMLAVHDDAHVGPVPLFEHASSTYAARRSFHAAAEAFASEFQRGDVDEYVEQAYGPEVTLEDVLGVDGNRVEFTRLAQMLWRPLIDHRRSTIGDLVRAVST